MHRNTDPIDDFAVGDDFDITRTITGIPDGQTIQKAWLMIKERSEDDDADAIITKTITAGTTTPGTITDTGADGTGEIRFHILTADSILLTPRRSYRLGIKVEMSNSYATHIEQDTIRLAPGVVAGEPA
jgi:hypothetical protein